MARRKQHWSVYLLTVAYAASIVFWVAAPSPRRLYVALATLSLLLLSVMLTRKPKKE